MRVMINAGPNLGNNTGADYEEVIKKYLELGAEKVVIMDCDCFWKGAPEFRKDSDYSKGEFFYCNPINTFRFTPSKPGEEFIEALRRIEINQWTVIATHQCGVCSELVEDLQKIGFEWARRGD